MLRRDGEPISTLDLFGDNFVVLAGPAGAAWHATAAEAAKALGLPVDSWQIGGGGLDDVDGRFLDAYGLAPGGAVLVRPDGFVAWRTSASAEQAGRDLGRTLASILDRPER